MAYEPSLTVTDLDAAAPLRIGSEEHKTLFCNQFIESYVDFEPATLPWPDLDQNSLDRLRSVPFWQQVRHTERRAAAIVAAYAEHVSDPLVRKAIELQGHEEGRHSRLLTVMVERYGIDAPEQPLEPLDEDLETCFTDFGFGECLDSFLGFGAFKLARQSQFLPDSMFEIFETLMFEETRHIVFFVNWMAWREAQRGHRASLLRNFKALRFYGRAAGRLASLSKRQKEEGGDGRDFSTVQVGQFLDGFNFRCFVEDCYRENARRMRIFEPRLLRPRFLPTLADAALKGFRLWSKVRARG